MGTTADTTSGGRLAASVMIFNTVWYTHKRPERRHKSCYFNEQRAKSVLSITGCAQTFNPVGLSCQDDDHSRHGGFPTNISHPWPSGTKLTQKEATGVYFALFDGGYGQAAMFVFPDRRNKETVEDKKSKEKGRAKKGEKKIRARKRLTYWAAPVTCFPSGKWCDIPRPVAQAHSRQRESRKTNGEQSTLTILHLLRGDITHITKKKSASCWLVLVKSWRGLKVDRERK